jgi:hypothetical protein
MYRDGQTALVAVNGLSDSEKRALVIADNRLPEQAVWNFDLPRNHFQALIDLDFDVELTGFSTGAVDLLIDGAANTQVADPTDDLASFVPGGPAIRETLRAAAEYVTGNFRWPPER